jgi:uncharacterized protein DUF6748
VISRSAIVLISAIVIVLSGTQNATSAAPSVGSSLYVVQGDPRLCPSPLCGGYWVALANHARTVCHDGARRPRCYVASLVGPRQQPPPSAVPSGALARAEIQSQEFEGLGELGVLVVADVFAPTGKVIQTGRVFRLVDTGIRCVRAPCFSYRASQVNQSTRTTLSGVDLRAAGATPADVTRAEAALATKEGLLARGGVVPAADGGRVFRATRLYLRSKS